MSDYPEHDKLSAISDQSQICGEFLEWLQGRGLVLAEHKEFDEYSEPQFVPSAWSVQDLLAGFFEIDRDKIEAEKRAMLAAMRERVSTP